MGFIIILVVSTQICITVCQNGRKINAMNDICSRTPGTTLCQWYFRAEDPSIEARPDPSRLREPETLLTLSSASGTNVGQTRPKPPVLPQPQQANEEQTAYCNRYKPSYTYYCDQRDTDDKEFTVVNFCSFYKKSCMSDSGGKPERPRPPAADAPRPATKKAYPAAQAKDIAKMCADYKAVADAYCKGRTEGLTKTSCDQYQYYCSNFKPDPSKSLGPPVPTGASEYCGTYAATYSKWCSGERSTPQRFATFCTRYYQICTALVANPPKPVAVSTPNFGDSQNPLASGFQGNKAENFGDGTNPLVNPAAYDVNKPQAPGPIVPGSEPAKAAPAHEVVPAPVPLQPAAAVPVSSWPGVDKSSAAFPQLPIDVVPPPFSPLSQVGSASGPQPGSSTNLGLGAPGGFGASTNNGQNGAASGGSTNLGLGVPGGFGASTNNGQSGASSGSSTSLGLGEPGDFGSITNSGQNGAASGGSTNLGLGVPGGFGATTNNGQNGAASGGSTNLGLGVPGGFGASTNNGQSGASSGSSSTSLGLGGPGGFGANSGGGQTGGPISGLRGSSSSLGFPEMWPLGNFGSSQGAGLGPIGVGSMTNTQAGPIGLSSGSAIGMAGGGNIPGLGQFGNGGLGQFGDMFGKRKRRK